MADDDSTRVVWPFRPNWGSTYTVTYEFKTDIFTSDDGSEQRRALRTTPRKTIEFTCLAAFDKLREFNRIMDTAQNLSIVMPEVTRFTDVLAPVDANAVALHVSHVPNWLVAGAEIILNDPQQPYFLAVVQAITGTTVTLTAAPGSLPVGTLLHPAVTGLLASNISAKRVTNSISTPSISFAVDPTTEFYPVTTAPLTYNGVEIVSVDPNWSAGVDTSHQWPIEIVDFGRGRTSVYRAVDFPVTARTYATIGTSSDALVEQFVRMRGQRTAFLTSTLEPDLVPVSGTLSGQWIDVVGTDAYYGYHADPVRSAIDIYAPGIGRWYAFVTDVEIAAGNTRLTLADTLPSIASGGVARISWLTLGRFATDTLQCVWKNTRVVQANVNIQTLPSSAADVSEVLRATVNSSIRQTVAGDNRAVIYI